MFSRFKKEKSGGILEYIILIAVAAVVAATLTPDIKTFMVDIFNKTVSNIETGITGEYSLSSATPEQEVTPSFPEEQETQLDRYRFKFDGETYIKLSNKLSHWGEGSDDFTLEGWFDYESSYNTAIYYKNGYRPYENQLGLGVFRGKYEINDGNTFDGNKVSGGIKSDVEAVASQKVHLAFVVKDNVISVYVNGSKVWTESVHERVNIDNDINPNLGTEIDYATSDLTKPIYTDFYKGYMYEVRLYSMALTEKEINTNRVGNTLRAGLAAEYLFDQGKGKIIEDSSGNNVNGEVVGNAVWEKY